MRGRGPLAIAFAPRMRSTAADGSPAGRQDGAAARVPGAFDEGPDARTDRRSPRAEAEPVRAVATQASWGRRRTSVGIPSGRIGALNRGNIVPLRQIDSACPPRLACARRNRHIHRDDQIRSCACPDRCSVHAARHRLESRRIYDYRSLHREPHRAAASHPGHPSLRPFRLVKRQRAVDDIRVPRPHEAHARERSRDH